MSVINYPNVSPYSSTWQSSWYLGRLNFKPIPPNSGDTLFTLTSRHNYRPDTLSEDLYNTPAYWWVFCARNPFLRADPIFGFTTGLVIVVPTFAYVQTMAGS